MFYTQVEAKKLESETFSKISLPVPLTSPTDGGEVRVTRESDERPKSVTRSRSPRQRRKNVYNRLKGAAPNFVRKSMRLAYNHVRQFSSPTLSGDETESPKSGGMSPSSSKGAADVEMKADIREWLISLNMQDFAFQVSVCFIFDQ